MMLPSVVRPLGPYEQFSSARHSLGLHKNVITVCRYALPETARTPARWRYLIGHALATLVRDKLPALRVGIAGEDSLKPKFVAVSSLDLRDHLEWSEVPLVSEEAAYDTSLLRLIEDEVARAWPDVSIHPPWRVMVYHQATENSWIDIAFAVHHAIADGKSGVSFHEQLLETLNKQQEAIALAAEGEVPSVLQFTEPPILVPPQEELVLFSISWSFLLRTLWNELCPSWPAWLPWPWSRAPAGPYTGKPVSFEPRLRSHLRVFHLAPADVSLLLAACRAHGVTLTATLHGLLLVLFARRVPAATARTFSCITPISLRPHAAPARMPTWLTPVVLGRSLSNMVAAFEYTFPPDVVTGARTGCTDDDAVWRAASTIGASLKAHVATLTQDHIAGLMGWVGDWHAFWRKRDGGVRDGTWGLSNTGSLDGGDSTDSTVFRITRNFYAYTTMGTNELVSVVVGGVRGGELSLLVAWHDGAVSDAFGESFAADLQACLETFGQTGGFAVPDRMGK